MVLDAYLTAGALARFGPGLTWEEILSVPGKTSRWWLHAVVDAEERGMLEWDAASLKWKLTPEGRQSVAWVS